MNTDIILQYFLEYLTEKKTLQLTSYQLIEEPDSSKIVLNIKDTEQDLCIEGTGVGMVDAGFNCLVDHFSNQFPSLKTIKLEDVYFQIDHRAGKDVSGKTKSLGYTGVSVLVSAVEFYINCELLFKRIKFLLEDAENRGREDVASRYRYVLSKVVEVTNYQTIA